MYLHFCCPQIDAAMRRPQLPTQFKVASRSYKDTNDLVPEWHWVGREVCRHRVVHDIQQSQHSRINLKLSKMIILQRKKLPALISLKYSGYLKMPMMREINELPPPSQNFQLRIGIRPAALPKMSASFTPDLTKEAALTSSRATVTSASLCSHSQKKVLRDNLFSTMGLKRSRNQSRK
ncbi:hypothetical protein DAPPUDRAFT_99811 [Daphnia pulex]|uniref:Uncharacterized protein n=1 Tax=Daphnia pulex TaxID=6669 RepID=E9G8D2_DAPPU|nr:hypothetical protein DAPPUDRAFT_99811 [Daphnia pulex]|eukprot:EFX84294.1 hypothetical protein DAPPUDRAFT_99811 [Daphnia pulex]